MHLLGFHKLWLWIYSKVAAVLHLSQVKTMILYCIMGRNEALTGEHQGKRELARESRGK